METSESILDFAAETGKILLENGAEISRVEDTMERIATHYGESDKNFFVLSNGIFTTGHSYAHTEFIPIKGARLEKVVAVNQLSRNIISDKLSLKEARERLEDIKKMPSKPLWEQFVGAGLGCAGFCAIFGGSLSDCLVALISALTLNLFVLKSGASQFNKTLGNICAGALGTILCIVFQTFGMGTNLADMFVGTLILLIPGVAFTNGLRDIGNEDYLAGMTRLMDSLMVFLCIAVGVCFAFIIHGWFAGGMIQLSGTVTDSFTSKLPIQYAAAMIGTSSFAVLFGVPRKHYASCGLVGTLGWVVYLLCIRELGFSLFAATFISSACVAIISRLAAIRLKCPSTVFLICGIFPLIPGAGVFWSSYYIASNQISLALGTGLSAIKITLAIVLGIIIASAFKRKTR